MNYSPTSLAGWFDDPEMALCLRWWDGTRQSHHTRPKHVVEQLVDQQPEKTPSSTAGTLASPAIGSPGSLPWPLATDGAPARHPDELWHAGAVSIDSSPERTNTSAVWALVSTSG